MLERLFGQAPRGKLKDLERRLYRLERAQRGLQRFLLRTHFGLSADGAARPDPRGVPFFSQHGEDGHLIHIFQEIGAPRRTFLEIGIQDGLECNTACFALCFGWRGVMLEGNADYARQAQENLAAAPELTIRHAFVTRDNALALLDQTGADREADLFSLDIDGNDYWIWEALEEFRPRVVVVEYNGYLGLERAVTIPYRPDFEHRTRHPRGYMGASLAAWHRLATRRGYALVGHCACNLFFVRREALRGAVREVPPQEVYLAPEPGPRTDRILAGLRGLELVEVG
jgi:hypothetical protein